METHGKYLNSTFSTTSVTKLLNEKIMLIYSYISYIKTVHLMKEKAFGQAQENHSVELIQKKICK